VWSAGVILLYMVGGDAIYRKLRGKTFNFFEFALRERSARWVDGSSRHRKWLQERALVGGDNLFYDTDMVCLAHFIQSRARCRLAGPFDPLYSQKKAPFLAFPWAWDHLSSRVSSFERARLYMCCTPASCAGSL